jgi:ketosteroid isomerase-like protein
MKKLSMLNGILMISIILTSSADAKGKGEKALRAAEERIVEGFKAKDADAIMANFVTDESLVVFDVAPPRQYVGAKAYRKDWADFFATVSGPIISCEISDLAVTTSGKLGLAHCAFHAVWNGPDGKKVDATVRVTDGFRKIDGKWLIIHEHVSAPVDLATGVADFASK